MRKLSLFLILTFCWCGLLYANERPICQGTYDDKEYNGSIIDGKCMANVGELKQLDDARIVTVEDPKFTNYKPNTGGYVYTSNEDDRHIELMYSFKYRLNDKGVRGSYLYFAYNGKFDFYWDTRTSSPVITRLNNPELHYKRYMSSLGETGKILFKHFDIGYGHESNGQSINDTPGYVVKGKFAQDYISRGWDYASAELKVLINKKEMKCKADYKCWHAYTYFRLFSSDGPFQGHIEDEIFWDTSVDEKIENYDGFRFILGNEFKTKASIFPEIAFSGLYRTGIANIGKNNTYIVDARVNTKIFGLEIPLYFKYFNGFGEEISDYSNYLNNNKRSDYWMVGVQFR